MERLEKNAIELLYMICKNSGCVISDSGGKDSSVLKVVAMKAHERYGIPIDFIRVQCMKAKRFFLMEEM